MKPIARLLTTAVICGSLGLVGLGLSAGTAHAVEPYQWCPGQDRAGTHGALDTPDGVNWDWNVCHTYYVVPYGHGNVSAYIWADSPPPPMPPPCGPIPCGLFP